MHDHVSRRALWKAYWNGRGIFWLVLVCSLLAFVVVYGLRVLDGSYTDWLMAGGDLSQHYLGWKLFRVSSWQPHVGMMDNIAYPFSESVIFTDSIPLFALVFKLLSPLLPDSFQFFGLWGLFCFGLQGLLSCMILKKYVRSDRQLFFGSLLFVFAPALLRRMYWHTSLAAHFILLLSIYFFVWGKERYDRTGKACLAWGALGALCSLVHIYYLPMCGLILLAFLAEDWLRNKKPFRILLPLLAYLAAAAFIIWALGGMASGMDDGAPGLAYYSFNLNGFFNPQDWSLFLKNADHYADGQFEGFAYLGLGVIVLFFAALACLYTHFAEKRVNLFSQLSAHSKVLTGGLACLGLVLAAASNELTFGPLLLFRYEIPHFVEELWASFRSSGRLVWPVVYFITLFSVCLVCRYSRKKSAILVLALCLALQLLDLSPVLADRHREFSTERIYESPLQNALWERIAQEGAVKHLVFMDKDNMSQEHLYAFADYAADHGMSINDFYFARNLMHPIKEVAKDFAAHPEKSCVYLFTEGGREQCQEYNLYYYEADGFIAGFSEPPGSFVESLPQL